jgi:transcriptional regulator with XRE-family HTH domain
MARGGKGKGPGAWQTSAAYEAALQVIIAARKSSGLTQRELATRLRKPPSWVGKIETKERRIDLVEFIAIGRALNLDDTKLFRTVIKALHRSKLDI